MNLTVIDMAATGKNIERLLREKGITVTELTCLMGFATTNAVYKWIRGETMPTLDNLVNLSGILRVTMDEIIVVQERSFCRKDISSA